MCRGPPPAGRMPFMSDSTLIRRSAALRGLKPLTKLPTGNGENVRKFQICLVSLELWDRHFNTNARGPFLLMQGLVRHLVETGKPGSIVNILSMVVHCGQSYLTAYSASKGALATLTKNVANAFAANRIRCNGILTGWMDTPGESATQQKFHGVSEDWLARAEATQPMRQLVKPHQLAGLAAYLLSPESGVMTGALIDYDQRVSGAYPE